MGWDDGRDRRRKCAYPSTPLATLAALLAISSSMSGCGGEAV
jgi:hypothetical protein